MRTRTIKLRPGDRATRDEMRAAHDLGRHGGPDAPLDVLEHWAALCADCHARWYYEFGAGRAAVTP